MFLHNVRINIPKIGIRNIVLFAVAGILFHQPLGASDSWSRITGLKSGTRVSVLLVDDSHWMGRIVRTDEAGLVVRLESKSEITMARALVLQVAVIRSHRRWYSIPLVIVAGAGGFAAGFGIASLMTCEENNSSCEKGRAAIMALFAGGAAGLAYKSIPRPSKEVIVIYNKAPTDANPELQ